MNPYQLDHDDGVVEVSGRAEGVLPLAVLGEPRGEDEPVLQVDGAGRLVPLVRHRLLLDLPRPRVNPERDRV